jgi:hypothetical protein
MAIGSVYFCTALCWAQVPRKKGEKQNKTKKRKDSSFVGDIAEAERYLGVASSAARAARHSSEFLFSCRYTTTGSIVCTVGKLLLTQNRSLTFPEAGLGDVVCCRAVGASVECARRLESGGEMCCVLVFAGFDQVSLCVAVFGGAGSIRLHARTPVVLTHAC